MPHQTLGVVGLFAGIGGIELGFQQAGFKPMLANEIDKNAVEVYRHNYKHPVIHSDVSDLSIELISSSLGVSSEEAFSMLKNQVLTGGFPCQPFSVAGYRKGFEDDRGNVFWEIIRIINLLTPRVVLLENVKNLESHDSGNTFRTIVSALQGEAKSPLGLGIYKPYFVSHKTLNSRDFGVPQNRERIYIVAFKDKKDADRFTFPEPEANLDETRHALKKFIDFEAKVDSEYYYTSKTPFFDDLKTSVRQKYSIYQWRRKYVRENKAGISPTLTANMGMGGHNVPLIKTDHGIRKLTPAECFNLMGMPEIKFPPGIARGQLYKQAGNAVVVPVIRQIAERIKISLG